VKIKFPWPYDLVQPKGWTYKRINVDQIGERWLIMRLEYAGDENERNDRYEMALNARLFRPLRSRGV
jgi:lipopolysaccharide export LptBFGC system permease protein LptF